MREQATGPSWKIRLRSILRDGYEPAPAEFVARQRTIPGRRLNNGASLRSSASSMPGLSS